MNSEGEYVRTGEGSEGSSRLLPPQENDLPSRNLSSASSISPAGALRASMVGRGRSSTRNGGTWVPSEKVWNFHGYGGVFHRIFQELQGEIGVLCWKVHLINRLLKMQQNLHGYGDVFHKIFQELQEEIGLGF